MKKKRIILIIAVIACLILGFEAYMFYTRIKPIDDTEFISETTNYLNKEVDFELLLYGDDIKLYEELEYKKISEINEPNYGLDNDYVYLVINDLSGKYSISEEKVVELVKYADKNPNFNFFYIGENSLDNISNSIENFCLNEGERSFGYVVCEGDRIQYGGLWGTVENENFLKNKDLLKESLIATIIRIIKTNE